MNAKKIVMNLTAFAVLVVIASPMVVTAAVGLDTAPTAQPFSISSLVNNILKNIWIVFAAIAIIFFIWAGVTFITAQGEPGKVATARQAAIWGIMGVVVMILAYSIFNIAESLISGSST
jgi:hypothetical protein